jgi:hypothetical protein
MYCRESNPVRLSSQLSRARRLFRAACANYRENPNNATRERRADRGLAFVSVRAKFVYVVACCKGADFSTAHKLGQAYQKANAIWKGEYQANIAL